MRDELLDHAERYSERMYDALCAEVRAAVVEEYEERAAIMEYCGNLPRYEAERLAIHLVIYGTLPAAEGVPQ